MFQKLRKKIIPLTLTILCLEDFQTDYVRSHFHEHCQNVLKCISAIYDIFKKYPT